MEDLATSEVKTLYTDGAHSAVDDALVLGYISCGEKLLYNCSVPKWSDFFGLWSEIGLFWTKRSENGLILHSKV